MSYLQRLEKFLYDPSVSDICMNAWNKIFIDQNSQLIFLKDQIFKNAEDFYQWSIGLLSELKIQWNANFPFINTSILDQHRLHIAFTSAGPFISIRCLPMRTESIHIENGLKRAYRWNAFYITLAKAFQKKESILIAGKTGSGKTTLAADLIEELSMHERIIALEDCQELRPVHPHFLSLQTREANADGFGEIHLQQLIKQALRMRPDRIILGECRGAEVLEYLQAINTGHHGCITTIHANSAAEAIQRLEILCHLQKTLPLESIRTFITLGIQWIAFVEKTNGFRNITQILKITGLEENRVLLKPIL